MTGVTVADIVNIAPLTSLAHMTVVDAGTTIQTDLALGASSNILNNLAEVASVVADDASLGAPVAAAIYAALGSKFDESALTISDAAAALLSIAAGTDAGALTVAAHVTLNADDINETAANAETLYTALHHTLSGRTLDVADSEGNLLSHLNADGIGFASSVELSGPATFDAMTATLLSGLHNFNTSGPAITVRDTANNLLNANYLARLNIANHGDTGPEDYALTADEITQLFALPHFIVDAEHGFAVQDNFANIQGMSTSSLNQAQGCIISDTSANVQSDIGALQAFLTLHNSFLLLPSLSPMAYRAHQSITVSAATYVADMTAIDQIDSGDGRVGEVTVTGNATDLAAIASQLAIDSVVGEVVVTDTSTHILSNLTALESIGLKFDSAHITDSPLNAAAVSSLLTIPDLTARLTDDSRHRLADRRRDPGQRRRGHQLPEQPDRAPVGRFGDLSGRRAATRTAEPGNAEPPEEWPFASGLGHRLASDRQRGRLSCGGRQ